MILIIPDNTNIQQLHNALYSNNFRLKYIEATTYLLTHTGDHHVPSVTEDPLPLYRPDHEPTGS